MNPIEEKLKAAFTELLKEFVEEASNSATDPELFIPKVAEKLVEEVNTTLTNVFGA